jgi:hypothetical protein
MKTEELTIQLGNVVINDFNNTLGGDMGFKLVKYNFEISQEYFYGKEKKSLTDEKLKVLFQSFQDRYTKLGIGALITSNFLMLGISHLSENQSKVAIIELSK